MLIFNMFYGLLSTSLPLLALVCCIMYAICNWAITKTHMFWHFGPGYVNNYVVVTNRIAIFFLVS